jgi:hypothetical protein
MEIYAVALRIEVYSGAIGCHDQNDGSIQPGSFDATPLMGYRKRCFVPVPMA